MRGISDRIIANNRYILFVVCGLRANFPTYIVMCEATAPKKVVHAIGSKRRRRMSSKRCFCLKVAFVEHNLCQPTKWYCQEWWKIENKSFKINFPSFKSSPFNKRPMIDPLKETSMEKALVSIHHLVLQSSFFYSLFRLIPAIGAVQIAKMSKNWLDVRKPAYVFLGLVK